MKTSALLLAIAIGAALGYLTGYIGTVVEHQNESQFGASYSRFEREWLAVPSLPGRLIMAWRVGRDLRVDEAWLFRQSTRTWNAVFYATLSLIVGTTRLAGRLTSRCQRRIP